MKVILTPQGGPQSPYIQLLVKHLKEAGVEVSLARNHALLLWRAVLANGRPDIIHLQWQHPHFNAKGPLRAIWRSVWFFLQLLTLKIMGVRFVWTVHNIHNHENHFARWEWLMNRLLARLVDCLIVHCEAAVPLATAAFAIPPEKVTIVPHAHFAGYYPPPPEKKEARQALRLPVDQRILLFIGQVRAYKGLDNLLKTFATLEAENTCLIIAGEPKPAVMGHSLAIQAAEDKRVRLLLEYIPDEQLTTFLSAADLVVLPYLESLTSGAAILAMSYGRPVLAPRLGCIRDFPAEVAILYDSNQADGLEQALRHALAAPLAEMGQAAKRYSLHFPWAETAVQTRTIYQSLLPAISQSPNLPISN
jgi:glycosyltransferase involved in cell wall biosynthesis